VYYGIMCLDIGGKGSTPAKRKTNRKGHKMKNLKWQQQRQNLLAEIDRQLAAKKRKAIQFANRIVLDLDVQNCPAAIDAAAVEIRYLAFQMRNLKIARLAAANA